MIKKSTKLLPEVHEPCRKVVELGAAAPPIATPGGGGGGAGVATLVGFVGRIFVAVFQIQRTGKKVEAVAVVAGQVEQRRTGKHALREQSS